MDVLIQKLHPALSVGTRLALAGTGQPLFSRQGDWDGGSTLHCVAMALALLGKLVDPANVRGQAAATPGSAFWDRAWPHYLHGLTLPELASFIWELNLGVRPVRHESSPAALLRFCTRELASGWPVIVGWRQRGPVRHHAALAIGTEQRSRKPPHALLLLDPAAPEPSLSGCNARLTFTPTGEKEDRLATCMTATATHRVVPNGAVSLRLIAR